MVKKQAGNSITNTNFAYIQIDPEVKKLADKGEQIARAVQESKQLYHRYERKRGIAHTRQERENNIVAIELDSAQIVDTRRAMKIDPIEHRQSIYPSNHNLRDQGFNGWSREFNKEARTGVTGKPTKRRDRNDPIHSAYPFVPKKR